MGIIFGAGISKDQEVEMLVHAIQAWSTATASMWGDIPTELISANGRHPGFSLNSNALTDAYDQLQEDMAQRNGFDHYESSERLGLFKRVAMLIHAIQRACPINYYLTKVAIPEDSKAKLARLSSILTCDCCWTVAFYLIHGNELVSREGKPHLIQALPAFMSEHLKHEVYTYFLDNMRVCETALILELLTYHVNPAIPGIRDKSVQTCLELLPDGHLDDLLTMASNHSLIINELEQ